MTSPKASVLLPHTWGEVKALDGVVANRAPDPTSALGRMSMKLHKVRGHWRMTSSEMAFGVLTLTT